MSPFTAELIGTMVMILLGDGVVANVVLNKNQRIRCGMDHDYHGLGISRICRSSNCRAV